MLVSIPLTDDERDAVEDGQAALGQLLERIADVPASAGPTPNRIGVPPAGPCCPIVDAGKGERPGSERDGYLSALMCGVRDGPRFVRRAGGQTPGRPGAGAE